MWNYSAGLQKKIDMRRYSERVPLTGFPNPGAAAGAGMPNLQPTTTHVFADNRQMAMYRDGLFMRRVATDPLFGGFGGDDPAQVQTWGLFEYNVI